MNQLNSIQPKQIQNIFDRLPDDRITPEAKSFALELPEYNRTQLLNFRRELIASSGDLISLYAQYSQNTQNKGLARANEIARNALADRVKSEQIAAMLAENNPAYRELVTSSGAKQAQKLIIKKVQVELALDRSNQSSSRRSPPREREKRISR